MRRTDLERRKLGLKINDLALQLRFSCFLVVDGFLRPSIREDKSTFTQPRDY